MLISNLLTDSAASCPERQALWSRGRWHTYGELDRMARNVAARLRAVGVAPGDRVGIFLDNSPEYVAAHFGAHLAGAVEVSFNVELKGEGLRQLLDNCEARALVTSLRTLHRWRTELSGLSQLRDLFTIESLPAGFTGPDGARLHSLGDALAADTTLPGAEVRPSVELRAPEDLATIVYTSGSTGEPKGVMLSHRNLVSNTRSIAEYLGLRSDDRMMVVLPFHYIFGRSLLYTHFLSGGSLILDNRFAFPSAILDTMKAQEATCFAGVPSTYSILLHKTDLRTRSFPSLRLLQQAGGGMAPALQKEVHAAFPGARLFVMYGSTEAAPRLTYVDPEALPRKWGSIGRAVPGVEVVVADEQANPLPQGQVGEIAARGPNIMLGYWKDTEGTARVLRHGYYFTGDLGYADEEGFIFLTGRSKDMIKTGGNRVSAKEIEDALVGVHGVLEAAVVPVPDEILGEAIHAFVVPSDPALTERQLRLELSNRLPSFKIPKFIEFRDGLPKNSSGKVLKTQLAHAVTPDSRSTH